MSEAEQEKTAFLNEYYSIPMAVLYREFKSEMVEALTARPNVVWQKALVSLCIASPGPVEASWEALLSIGDQLEIEIARTLSKRHVFFWQHLYRRIFPAIYDETGKAADEVTTRLVRSICEAAIVKHGRLDGRTDLENVASTDIEKVFGGWLSKGVRQHAESVEQAERFLQHFKLTNQWVIVDFAPQDLIDLYYVEGLCYHYWKLTSRLRMIGKGAQLIVFKDGSNVFLPNDRLRRLFASYDERAADFSDAKASGIGVWYEGQRSGERSILCFFPNAGKADLGPLFAAHGLNLYSPDGSPFLSNFVAVFIDGDDFIESHAYIADAFKEAKGFSIGSAIECLHALTEVAVIRYATDNAKIVGEEHARAYNFLGLCKRAYMPIHSDQVGDFIGLLRSHMSSCGVVDREMDALFSAFTLTETTRRAVSLWSRGPQFVFYPYDEMMLIDFSGIVELLFNLFVGVRDDAHARGMLFEENVRQALSRRGVKLEQRKFKFLDDSRAEADAVFYKDGKLIVADCFSMWRPLDFEISRPKTVSRRCDEIEKKARYALSRSLKLRGQLVGRNFDFSPATEVVTVVVTPNVEWLWDESELLWIAPGVPRVMQADEFIEWAIDES